MVGVSGLRNAYARADKLRLLKLGVYGVLLAFVVFLLVTGRGYRWEDRIVSLIVGVPGVVLILVALAFTLKPGLAARFRADGAAGSLQEKFSESIEGRSGEGRSGAERRKYEFLLIVWITALPVAIYYLGMAIVPVFVFGFIWFFHGSLRAATIVTVLFTVTVYVVFVWFLNLLIWPGALFT